MKIVLATGGGGGHLVPALKVAQELRLRGHEILFIGSFPKRAQEIFKQKRMLFKNLPARGLSWRTILPMLKAIRQAFQILKQFQADVVVGFGSYGSCPAVLSAKMLGFSILLHEQNVVPGKANIFLSRFATKIAISFPNTQKYFSKRKVILTGCPHNIDDSKIDKKVVLKEFGLEENRKTILVLGGSQGSECINKIFMQAIKRNTKDWNIQVIHVSGERDCENLRHEYVSLKIPVALFAFLDSIQYAYKLADLVIARAGAVTVAEITAVKTPAIFIPYPFAGGHQKYNTEALCKSGLADMIEQKDLTVEKLENRINFYMAKVAKGDSALFLEKKNKKKGAVPFCPETKRLTQAILEVAHR